MTSLFKYMPYRVSFFKDPLLRLTPPIDFNDIFDSMPTKKALLDMACFLNKDKREISDFNELNNIEKEIYHKLLYSHKKYGIISLSMDKYSLLMWSHYADEHKGIVVEFDDNQIFCDESEGSVFSKLFNPVFYSNKRYEPLYLNKGDIEINLILKDRFYRKSLDWIYEQEYRYVSHIESSDCILYETKNEDMIEYIKNEMGVVYNERCDGSFMVYKEEQTNIDLMFQLYWNVSLSNLGTPLCFKRVNPKAIKSIYFGCLTNESDQSLAINLIKESSMFHENMKFYRGIPSSQNFEIDFQPIELPL